MELFGTLVLILSAIKTLRSRLVPNSFPKQVPWSNSIKTLLQSSTETSEWLPDRFHSRESLYIMRRVQSSQDLFVHQYDRSFIVLYTNMAEGEGGGGGEVGDFFSCGNNSLYSLSTHPLVRVPPVLRLNSPLSPTQPFFVLSRNAPRHCEKAQRTADCRLIELELRKVFGQSSL